MLSRVTLEISSMSVLLYGDDVDRRLNWPLGKAERLAHRGKLPHLVLPDGAIRFRWKLVRALLVSVPAFSSRAHMPENAAGIATSSADAAEPRRPAQSQHAHNARHASTDHGGSAA